MNLPEHVHHALLALGVADGDGIVVGCSHGPDSLALTDILLAQRSAVTPVYVDHGLRPEAALEAAAVLALSPHSRVVSVTVGRQGGLEAAARAARYAALERVCDEVGARWIAVAHTASDQAETVVQRLLRGAGVVGLAGIPARRGRVVRPLLGVDRRAVIDHLAARGLRASHDATNDSPDHLRNRVRHDLLPSLRRENPRVDEALVRAAAASRELADALDWAAGRARAEVVRGDRLDAKALAALPAAVAKRLLQQLLGPSLEARHLEAVLALAARPTAGSVEIALPGRRLRREYGELVLGAEPAAPPLTVEGDDGPYLVRGWRPGDRMRPASLRGRSRKLQDLFTDRKVPRAARALARVVVREADGAIVWVEHVGAAAGTSVRVSGARG